MPNAHPLTPAAPEIPTIATHAQQMRRQQHWRTLWLSMGVLHAYYLCAAWLPHPLRLPVAWLALMPPLLPGVCGLAIAWWWQPWRPRPVVDPFAPIPAYEDQLP